MIVPDINSFLALSDADKWQWILNALACCGDCATEESEISDPSQHINFCSGVQACLGIDDDGLINSSYLPSNQTLSGDDIINLINSSDLVIDEDRVVDNDESLTGEEIVTLINNSNETINNTNIQNPDCDDIISCVTDADGFIKDELIPGDAEFELDCEDVVGCFDSDGDGIIDGNYLPSSYVIPAQGDVYSTFLNTNNDTVSYSLSNISSLDPNECPKYVDLLVTIGASSLFDDDNDANTPDVTSGSLFSYDIRTWLPDGTFLQAIVGTHPGDNIDQQFSIKANVENCDSIPLQVITSGDNTLQCGVIITTTNIYY